MTPETIGQYNDFQYVSYPTKSWLINEDTGSLELSDDNEALMRQAINIRIQIERFQYTIFSSNVGMQTIDLPGQDLPLIISDLQRRITDCLMCDDRINNVENFEFNQLDEHSILVTFDVDTIFGIMQKIGGTYSI